MALDKNVLQPGVTTVKVKSLKQNTAGIGLPNVIDDLPGIRIWDVQNKQWGRYTLAPLGSVLTIIKKPRRINNVNFCRVSFNNIEGEVFWTELRSNTELCSVE